MISLRDAAQKLWDALRRLNRDTAAAYLFADIIALTPGVPPQTKSKLGKKWLMPCKKGLTSEYASINGFILPSHSYPFSRGTAPSTHVQVQQQFRESCGNAPSLHTHGRQATASTGPEFVSYHNAAWSQPSWNS